MLNLTSNAKAHTCDGVSRRDFIQVGSLGAVGLSLPQMVEAQESGAVKDEYDDRNVIMIFNLGAPSQIDTFDHRAWLQKDANAKIIRTFQ